MPDNPQFATMPADWPLQTDDDVDRWYASVRERGVPPAGVSYRVDRCPQCGERVWRRLTPTGYSLVPILPVTYDGPHRCEPATVRERVLQERIDHLERILSQEARASDVLQAPVNPDVNTSTQHNSKTESATSPSRQPVRAPATQYRRNSPATSPPEDTDRTVGVELPPET